MRQAAGRRATKRMQVRARVNLSTHSQHFRAARTRHGGGENQNVRITDPI